MSVIKVLILFILISAPLVFGFNFIVNLIPSIHHNIFVHILGGFLIGYVVMMFVLISMEKNNV